MFCPTGCGRKPSIFHDFCRDSCAGHAQLQPGDALAGHCPPSRGGMRDLAVACAAARLPLLEAQGRSCRCALQSASFHASTAKAFASPWKRFTPWTRVLRQIVFAGCRW